MQRALIGIDNKSNKKMKNTPSISPNLLVFIKPFYFALRSGINMIISGPPPQACLNCFEEISTINNHGIERFLNIISEQSEVLFIQIGSNDGKTGDPIYKFVSKRENWRGVLVEPISYLHERLKKNYSHRNDLKFEKVIITNKRGKIPFYYVSNRAEKKLNDLPEWYNQLGNFSKEHIINHLGEKISPFIEKQDLEALTLNDLFERNSIDRIDLLHIDTEGHDLQILKQLDFSVFSPQIIIIEYKHLVYWDCYRLVKLLYKNYKIHSNGSDLIAVKKQFLHDNCIF